MTISYKWTAGLPKGKSKEFEDLVRNSTVVLGKLKQIVEDERKAVIRVREADYEKASWSYWQAHRNGKLEVLDHMLELLKFMDKE